MTAIIETDQVTIEIDFKVDTIETSPNYEQECYNVGEVRMDGIVFSTQEDKIPDSFIHAMDERYSYEGNLDEY